MAIYKNKQTEAEAVYYTVKKHDDGHLRTREKGSVIHNLVFIIEAAKKQ